MEPLWEPGSLRSTAHVPEPSLPASDLWVPGWGVFMGRRAALDSQGLTKREAKGQAGLCCLNKSSRQVPSLLLPSLPSAAHDPGRLGPSSTEGRHSLQPELLLLFLLLWDSNSPLLLRLLAKGLWANLFCSVDLLHHQ